MMNNASLRFRLPLSLAIVASLAAAACEVQSDSGDVNGRVEGVTVVGTSVTSALYSTGALGLTTIPLDSADQAVLGKGLKVGIRITAPFVADASVSGTECTEPEQGKKAINVGVIIDDSGSMGSNDPKVLRKDATISFLKTLGADDKVLLTDYGASGNKLRDLLCISGANPTGCSPVLPQFSSDKDALMKAAEKIEAAGGTPLYETCAEMAGLVDTVKDGRRGILLLSDGEPNDEGKRDACHSAAKNAGIPVFTVGLGPAAEGDKNVSDTAVKVLRELATDTGGSYASANDAAQLDGLFRNMGTALSRGSCKTDATIADAASRIKPGDKVTAEVAIGDNGAKASFEFIAPANK